MSIFLKNFKMFKNIKISKPSKFSNKFTSKFLKEFDFFSQKLG